MQQNILTFAPVGVLCNLRQRPLGFATDQLRISWSMRSNAIGAKQTAYRILIATSKENAEKGTGDWYDSGKILSAKSVNVVYEGTPLEKESVYYLRVQIWNERDESSELSETVKIITEAENFPKQGMYHESQAPRFVFFRRILGMHLVSGKIKEAFAYVTATETEDSRQYACKFYVNGALVGVGPSRSAVKRPYDTYDILPYLKRNKQNVIGGICCSGTGTKFFAWRIVLCYVDGTKKILDADQKVMTYDGDACYGMTDRYTSYYTMGNENICVKAYPYGFSTSDFAAEGWTKAVVSETTVDCTPCPTDAMELPPIVPQSYRQRENSLIFDMGKETIGMIRITFSCFSKESKICIRLGEQKTENGSPQYRAATGVTYDETWTIPEGFSGSVETFGYRAFRYGEITDLPQDVNIQIEVIRLACPFNRRVASFQSNNVILDTIWDVCKYTVEAATMDMYQDCPTRERGPYEGDAYIHQLSHYSVDRKFDVARYSLEYLYYHPTWCEEYKPLIVLAAWEDYMATADNTSLAEHYEVLCQKVRIPDETGMVGILQQNGRPILVDWPPTIRDGYQVLDNGVSHNTVASAFHAAAWLTLAKIATVLNKTEDAKTFAAYGEIIKNALKKTILPNDAFAENLENLEKEAPSAHASFYPVAFSLVDKETCKKAMEYVLTRPSMPCNVYGTQFLLTAMYQSGMAKNAYDLLVSQEMRSWYHMIFRLGATTATEAWDFSLKPNMTMCHAWASSPLFIAARFIAGVSPLLPGYEKIQVCPNPDGLKEFHAGVPTIRGTVYVDWLEAQTTRQLTVTIPANAEAEIGVPIGKGYGTKARINGEEKQGEIREDRLFFRVPAGMYFICL